MKMYIFAILGLALVAGSAMAYPGWQDKGLFHEDMEFILEEGSYTDLEALREETGRPMMPWVQDEDDFTEWQKRHELMEAHGEGLRLMRGLGYGFGHGRGGCH